MDGTNRLHAADFPTFDAWLNHAYGAGADRVREHMHRLFAGDERLIDAEIDVMTAQGDVRRWSFSASAPGRLRDGRRFIVGMALDITERKQAEEARRRSESHLAAIYAQASVGLCELSLDGRVETANEELCKMLGRSFDELRGCTVTNLTHPGDVELCVRAVDEAIRTGESAAAEKRFIRPDGSVVWASSRLKRLDDSPGNPRAVLAVLVDLTVRKAAESALTASEERLRLIVENARDYAIFSTDLQHRITTWNPGAERILGYTEKEAVGQVADLVFTPEDRAADIREMEDADRPARWSRQRRTLALAQGRRPLLGQRRDDRDARHRRPGDRLRENLPRSDGRS